MKLKINKIMKIGAAALFVFALFLNVNMSLDDPFVYIGDTAIATGTGTGSGGWLWQSQVTTTACEYSLVTTVRVEDPNNPGTYIETTESVTYTGVIKNCIDGWKLCATDCIGSTT